MLVKLKILIGNQYVEVLNSTFNTPLVEKSITHTANFINGHILVFCWFDLKKQTFKDHVVFTFHFEKS